MAFWAPPGMTEKRIFRSTAARVGGWLWMAFAAANLADIAVRGRDLASVIAAAVLLLGCGIAYVIGLRPRIVADENGVRLHNPLRDVVVPWQAVQKITASDSIRIIYTGPDGEQREARSWVLQTSPRARVKAEQRAKRSPDDELAQYVKNRTPADFAVEQLTELAEAHSRGAGRDARTAAVEGAGPNQADTDSAEAPAGRVVWWPPAVAALAVPALLLAGAVLVAILH
ncbi:MAG: hypothetical protein JWN52_4813 [Actinomycetia bacterium]|nr:hypothetical protein [Actinomycetes bacterium]